MIIASKSENKLMSTLVKHWYKSFSAYELAREAKVTNPLVYSLMPKLKKNELVYERNKLIAINKSSLFVYRYKLLYDANKILQLSQEQKKIINDIFAAVRDSYNAASFIVIGSLAELAKEPKDYDFLVIGEKRKEINYQRLLRLGSINIIEKTEEEIRNDFLNADDFLISCLLSHIVYYDNEFFWHLMQQELPFPSPAIINQRKEQLFKLEKRLKLMLKDKDNESLVGEFKKFLIKKARIILLENKIYPLSKNDILAAIKKIEPEIHALYFNVNNKNALELVAKYV